MATPGESMVYPTMPGALRSATAQLLHLDGKPEWLFLFPDLVRCLFGDIHQLLLKRRFRCRWSMLLTLQVVRPRGQFQLEAVLLNVRA